MGEDFSIYNGEGTELRKAQLRMLDILTEIDKICKKHDIPYWIDFGTLLGAVRHKGFIPWDDDLDITIFRKDNRRLQKYLAKELPDRYYIFSEKTSKSFKCIGYFKVVDKNSRIIKRNQDASHLFDEGNGICVDIFNIEKGSIWFKKYMDKIHGRVLRRMKNTVNDGWLKKHIAFLIYPFSSLILVGYRFIMHIIPHKNYIYCIPNVVVKQMFSQRNIDHILPIKPIMFEGASFNAPNNPDAFLSETYHNYMTIPSKENRFVHTSHIETDDE